MAGGYWTADDLTAVIRILARNRHTSTGLEGGWARLRVALLVVLLAADAVDGISAAEQAGLARKVVKLAPVICVKG